jgi:predicted kinase
MGLQTIIICKGLPGSGKSTWSLEYLRKHPGQVKRVNKDLIREMLDGTVGQFDEEKMVLSIRDFIIEKALSKHFDVVVDDTNFKDTHYFAICDAAKRVGNVRVFEKYFDITLKEALARNKGRLHPVPESIITQMFETNIKNKHMELRDVYFGAKSEYLKEENLKARLEPGLGEAIIIDLDGTLALNFTLRDYYDLDRLGEDTLNTVVAELIELYSDAGYFILLVSGRDEQGRAKTEEWLHRYNISYDHLYMRSAGDIRNDVIIKKEIYDQQIKGKYNVRLAVDDRKKVSRMFREELGIPVFQIDDVDF